MLESLENLIIRLEPNFLFHLEAILRIFRQI